jgi:hypothetical protein
MKTWINKNRIPLLLSILGSIAGYTYWSFVGCESGSCAITSVWWRATIYGALMGWLVGSLIKDSIKKKTLSLILITTILYSCSNDSLPKQEEVTEIVTKSIDSSLYITDGKTISAAVFKSLSSNLKQAMTDGGVDSAIKFCSINAQPLTDSLSNYYQVAIKRTSHKIRNQKNAPNENELAVIDDYLAGNLSPQIVQNENESVSYYAPIPTKGLCVVCHGEVGKTIAEKDYQTILSNYPDDKATGFKAEDLRGIWSITFNK